MAVADADAAEAGRRAPEEAKSAASEEEDLGRIQGIADAVEAALEPVEDSSTRVSGGVYLHCVLEDRLYIGGAEVSAEALRGLGITHVVRVIDDSHPPSVLPEAELTGVCRVPVADTISVDLRPHFPVVRSFIREALAIKGRVYVHCGQGRSRAASMVLMYLITEEGLDLRAAFTRLLVLRDISLVNMAFLSQLVDLDEDIHGVRSMPLLALYLVKRRRADAVRKSPQRLDLAEVLALWDDPNARLRSYTDSMSHMSITFGMRDLRQVLGFETCFVGPSPATRCGSELRRWFEDREAKRRGEGDTGTMPKVVAPGAAAGAAAAC